jgi:hypothetical protein
MFAMGFDMISVTVVCCGCYVVTCRQTLCCTFFYKSGCPTGILPPPVPPAQSTQPPPPPKSKKNRPNSCSQTPLRSQFIPVYPNYIHPHIRNPLTHRPPSPPPCRLHPTPPCLGIQKHAGIRVGTGSGTEGKGGKRGIEYPGQLFITDSAVRGC